MIEIKPSRKLHCSGYRLMQIKNIAKDNVNEVINETADVLHIGFEHSFDGINIDITKNGIIRIWSDNYDLIPNKYYRCSDSVFMLRPKKKDDF